MKEPIPSAQLVQAYRDLYRASLRAVHYARPARFQVRDILRTAFRTLPQSQFNARRVTNTLKFLDNARLFSGYEHKVLKELAHMQYWKGKVLDKRMKNGLRDSNAPTAVETRKQIWWQYRATLTMLNESLDIYLTI
jgi:hypothetical protein